MMRIRVFNYITRKKGYVIKLLFSQLSADITNYRVFYRKIAIYYNLSKQVQNLSFNDPYYCLTTKKIVQLKIICLKFVNSYIFRNLSLKISRELSKNLDEKILFCSPLPKFCSKNFSDFFYIMRIRVSSLQNKKKNRYVIDLLFSELS